MPRACPWVSTGDRRHHAIQEYTKAIELNPKYVEAYRNRGADYYYLGKYQQAVMDYSMVLELNPKDYEVSGLRAITYARLGKKQEAINDMTKALGLKQDDDGIYYNGACMYTVLNQTNKACEYLRKSIEKGYGDWDWIKKDNDLNNIRNEACYKEIMAGK